MSIHLFKTNDNGLASYQCSQPTISCLVANPVVLWNVTMYMDLTGQNENTAILQ